MTDGSFTTYLRNLIESRGMRKSELARRAGITNQRLHGFTSGDRRLPPDLIWPIVRAMDLTPGEAHHLIVRAGLDYLPQQYREHMEPLLTIDVEAGA